MEEKTLPEITLAVDESAEKTSANHLNDFLLKVVLPAILIFILANIFFNTVPENEKEKVQNAWMAGNRKPTLEYLKKEFESDFFNIKKHRLYLNCQEYVSSHSKYEYSQDKDVCAQYSGYTNSPDPNTVDVGFYGLGLFHSLRNEYEAALECYSKVHDPNLPYLNNSIGHAYLQTNRPEKAKPFLLREIELGNYCEGAYSNLSQMYFEARDLKSLDKLIADEKSKEFVPLEIVRYVDLCHMRFLPYLKDRLSMNYVSAAGSLAALLILFIWFQYLRKLDVFEPERLLFLLSALFIGMIFSIGCHFLYDIYSFAFQWEINGNIINDLFYCIFGIGVIEETVKIIPFLLILKFTKQLNESIDYVIYAAVPALGFAFMENLLYFQDSGLHSITGRCMTAVLLHISMSTFAAYGLFYAKYRKNNQHRLRYFAVSFSLACLVHGVYDFWLIADVYPSLKLFSILILMISIGVFSNIVKNALNQSEFNNEQVKKIAGLSKHLVYSLSYVILLQYVLIAYKFGAPNANFNMLQQIGLLYFVLFIVFSSLAKMELNRGRWHPLFERQYSADTSQQSFDRFFKKLH